MAHKIIFSFFFFQKKIFKINKARAHTLSQKPFFCIHVFVILVFFFQPFPHIQHYNGNGYCVKRIFWSNTIFLIGVRTLMIKIEEYDNKKCTKITKYPGKWLITLTNCHIAMTMELFEIKVNIVKVRLKDFGFSFPKFFTKPYQRLNFSVFVLVIFIKYIFHITLYLI